MTDKIKIRLGAVTLLRFVMLAVLACGGAAGARAAGNPPTGRWLTPAHDAVIQIAPCGTDLCGQIVGIALPTPNTKMPLAWAGQPQCGMVILQTSPTAGATAWVGKVVDPRDGSVYQARMVIDQNRQLELHGYIGLPIFGQTQVWTPYAGPAPAGCRLADAASLAISKNG